MRQKLIFFLWIWNIYWAYLSLKTAQLFYFWKADMFPSYLCVWRSFCRVKLTVCENLVGCKGFQFLLLISRSSIFMVHTGVQVYYFGLIVNDIAFLSKIIWYLKQMVTVLDWWLNWKIYFNLCPNCNLWSRVSTLLLFCRPPISIPAEENMDPDRSTMALVVFKLNC